MRKPTAKAKPVAKPVAKPAAPKPTPPTVGRIVHYYDHDMPLFPGMDVEHGPFAAIVTLVRPPVEADEDTGINAADEQVDVYVFVPGMNGQVRGGIAYAHKPIPHDKTQAHNRRYWTWPPRD